MAISPLSCTMVVLAATLDRRTGHLVLLLDRGVDSSRRYALDVIETQTGAVRRLELELPEGENPQTLSQLAMSPTYLWFRGRPGESLYTLRLERGELDKATLIGKFVIESNPDPSKNNNLG